MSRLRKDRDTLRADFIETYGGAPSDNLLDWMERIENRPRIDEEMADLRAANSSLEAQIVSLRAAVRGLLPHVFTWQTGDPSEYPMLVEFWESEQKLGRGEAAAVLAAYATLSSTGEG